MADFTHLPIYRDTYALLLEIYRLTNEFSKDYRYGLGQDMKRDALSLFRTLYNIQIHKAQRPQYQAAFLQDFEMLKIELRLCTDLNVVSVKRMAVISLLSDSISRQMKLWRKKETPANLFPYRLRVCV